MLAILRVPRLQLDTLYIYHVTITFDMYISILNIKVVVESVYICCIYHLKVTYKPIGSCFFFKLLYTITHHAMSLY